MVSSLPCSFQRTQVVPYNSRVEAVVGYNNVTQEFSHYWWEWELLSHEKSDLLQSNSPSKMITQNNGNSYENLMSSPKIHKIIPIMS